MSSPRSVARMIVCLVLAVGAGAGAGCQSGPGGEPMGVRSYENGQLTGNVPGDLEAVTEAVMRELVEMGVLNAEDRREADVVEIQARTLAEVPLEIRIERRSAQASSLVIRAGTSEGQARSLFGRVRSRLQAQFN